MIRKHPQINHVEATENVKWCVFKVPQYIYIYIFKKGKTELKSLCITRRLMLIDICFMKMS